jgi:hypothetical protein
MKKYEQGRKDEREFILSEINKMIYSHKGIESWTNLLRQLRDSLEDKK